ncbi:hypothetical protein GPECTOR_11g106 [Gonium pectorale]|uniref:Uncharacterized protein n=1 Tax=Gonium pectorale TaxID=33097 RepID=A0A150GPI8_GONPE|nr:hypothetical protein GPECTOR_11g106 [Gonium pectorale]|eukprot:KXZ51652.1 hypothetical protein GPECTOR_11g106 [Gonium pectorale]
MRPGATHGTDRDAAAELEELEQQSLDGSWNFLQFHVLSGPARRLVGSSDMQGLAEALWLAAEFGRQLPPACLRAIRQRAEQLMSEATGRYPPVVPTATIIDGEAEREWLVRMSVVVLETQDADAAVRRSELMAERESARGRLSDLQRQCRQAQKASSHADQELWRSRQQAAAAAARAARGGGKAGGGQQQQRGRAKQREAGDDDDDDADVTDGDAGDEGAVEEPEEVVRAWQVAAEAKAAREVLEAEVAAAEAEAEAVERALSKMGPPPPITRQRVDDTRLFDMLAAASAACAAAPASAAAAPSAPEGAAAARASGRLQERERLAAASASRDLVEANLAVHLGGADDPRVALAALAALADSGARERRALPQRAVAIDLTAVGHKAARDATYAEGLFGPVLMMLIDCLSAYAAEVQQPLSLAEAAEALEHIAVLAERLEGADCLGVWARLPSLMESFVKSRKAAELRQDVAADPEGLWAFLRAAHRLGGHRWSDAVFCLALRDVAQDAGADDPHATHPRVRAAELIANRITVANIRKAGPFLLPAGSALQLWRAARPLVQQHGLALQQLTSSLPKRGKAKALSPELRGGVLPSVGADPRFLTAQQLGLLYGMLAVRGPASSDGKDAELEEAVVESRLDFEYTRALLRAAVRRDLPPLEHVTLMLDSLEPALLYSRNGDLRPQDLYSKRLYPVEDLIDSALVRLMTDDPRVAAGPAPEGLGLWDERRLILFPSFTASAELSEEILMEALIGRGPEAALCGGGRFEAPPYLAALGSRALRPAAGADGDAAGATAAVGEMSVVDPEGLSRLVEQYLAHPDPKVAAGVRSHCGRLPVLALPLALRPPPGRRHGGLPADPDGDAAREEYVRELLPWLNLARRVGRFALVSESDEVLFDKFFNGALLEGRWSLALAYALHPVWPEIELLRCCLSDRLAELQFREAMAAVSSALTTTPLGAFRSLLPYGCMWVNLVAEAKDLAGTSDGGDGDGGASRERTAAGGPAANARKGLFQQPGFNRAPSWLRNGSGGSGRQQGKGAQRTEGGDGDGRGKGAKGGGRGFGGSSGGGKKGKKR